MQVRHASQLLPKINQDSCSGNIVFSELDVVEFVVEDSGNAKLFVCPVVRTPSSPSS